MKHKADEKTRHFGGELKVQVRKDEKGQPFLIDQTLRNFENKHLRAYLKGDKEFSFGKNLDNRPLWFKVKENWY